MSILIRQQEEAAGALAADTKGAPLVRVDDKYTEGADPSDDEGKS